MLTYYWKRKQ